MLVYFKVAKQSHVAITCYLSLCRNARIAPNKGLSSSFSTFFKHLGTKSLLEKSFFLENFRILYFGDTPYAFIVMLLMFNDVLTKLAPTAALAISHQNINESYINRS